MDPDIIRALKAKYLSLAVRKLILALEKKEPILKFSILSAIYMLKKGDDHSILKEGFSDQIAPDISLDEYADFDIEVSTSHGKLTNAEIITEVTGTQEDSSDDEESDNVEGEPIIKPWIKKEQKAIGILEDFSLYSKLGEAMMRSPR